MSSKNNSFNYIKDILFDALLEPPKLIRSYKTLCACGNITHVYNKERIGGVCCKCIDNYKRHKL